MKIVRRKTAALLGVATFGALAAMMFDTDRASAYGKACSMGGGTQVGNVDVTQDDPSVCVRWHVPGAVIEGLDPCHWVAKNILGCTTVYTALGPPQACTMGGGTQLGSVFVTKEDPSVCVRKRVPGPVVPGLDSCHSTAHNVLGCTTVHTLL